MLDVEDGRLIMNMASNVEGHTRRAQVQLREIGCARYPTAARFLPLSRLRPKLAFQASQRNGTQLELSLPNLRFGELGSEDSRIGELTVVL